MCNRLNSRWFTNKEKISELKDTFKSFTQQVAKGCKKMKNKRNVATWRIE